MEAIVKISGKQYRVAEGARLSVDRLGSKVGDEVTFGDVLLLTDGPKATVGTPTVEGAAVTARVVAATRGPKLLVYKYKAKKRYRRTQGARAELSLLEVLTVKASGSKAKTAKATAAPETKSPAPESRPAAVEAEAAKPAKAAPRKATADKPSKPAKARTADKPTTAEEAVKPESE